MRFNRLAALTMAGVLAAASLTACGGSAAKDTTAAAAKAPAAESTAEKTGEGAGTDETEKAAGTEGMRSSMWKVKLTAHTSWV